MASHAYRSTQAYVALRQLSRGAAKGVAASDNPAIVRLAKAMQVNAVQAHDIYMGKLQPSVSAVDIVNAHKALLGASRVSRLFGSHSAQVSQVLREVRSVHVKAIHETIELSQHTLAERKKDQAAARHHAAKGNTARTRQSLDDVKVWLRTERELTDELEILSCGLSETLRS